MCDLTAELADAVAAWNNAASRGCELSFLLPRKTQNTRKIAGITMAFMRIFRVVRVFRGSRIFVACRDELRSSFRQHEPAMIRCEAANVAIIAPRDEPFGSLVM